MRWRSGSRSSRIYMPERILPVTLEIAQEWGRLSALRPIPPEDGLLAATAPRAPADLRHPEREKRRRPRSIAAQSMELVFAGYAFLW